MALTCEEEFNLQLQALQSRVRGLEEQTAASIELTFQHMLATFAGLTATGTGIGPFIANPFMLAIIIGGAIDPEIWRDVQGMLAWATNFKQMFAEWMVDTLQIPPYGAGLISTVGAWALGEIAAAQAALDAAIIGGIQEEIDAAQAVLDHANAIYAAISDAFTSQDHLTACATAAHIFGRIAS